MKRSGTHLPALLAVFIVSTLLALAQSSLTPMGNYGQSDMNANGHSMTNAGTVQATNVYANTIAATNGITLNGAPVATVTGSVSYSTNSGYATNAGVATNADYATNSGAATNAAYVPVGGITGAGSGVTNALSGATGAAGGVPVLDSGGYVPAVNLYWPSMRVYEPMIGSGTSVTVQAFNVVHMGDSITEGGGASVSYSVSYNQAPAANPTGYPASLQTMGFSVAAGTQWPFGMGGELTGNMVNRFYNSPGETCSVSLTNSSTSGTLTACPQAIINGGIVTGTGIPSNTTMTFTAVVVKATVTNGTATVPVSSTSGLSTGMFVGYLNSEYLLSEIATSTTISSIGSGTITLSDAPTGTTAANPAYLICYSPSVVLSNAYTGTTGTQTLTSAGTLLTGTATFTANSTTATLSAAVTGLAPTATWAFGMGSTCTPPGDTFTALSGITLTLSQAATASGTVTFYASAPTHDKASASDYVLYPQGINSSPYLVSPNVTGVPGYFIFEGGINDSSVAESLATFQSNVETILSDAAACGYTVGYMAIVPPASNNTTSESTSWVAAYNGWYETSPSALSAYTFFDLTKVFPTGNPQAPGDVFHYKDGTHPSDLGHTAIARYLNDKMMALWANPAQCFVTSNFGNGRIQSNWLPAVAARTDLPNVFGTAPVFGATLGVAQPQTIFDMLTVSGIYADAGAVNIDDFNPDLMPGTLNFRYNNFGAITSRWTLSGSGTAYTINDDVNGQIALSVPASPDSNATLIGGGLKINNSASVGSNGPQAAYGLTVNGNAGSGCLMSDNYGQGNDFIFENIFSSSNLGFQFWTHSGTVLGEFETGGLVLPTAGTTVSLKGGSNAASGTVTLSSGAGTITSTAITTSSVIFVTLKPPASGTPGTYEPMVSVNSAGAATVTGASTDNSTYNWGMLQVNQ